MPERNEMNRGWTQMDVDLEEFTTFSSVVQRRFDFNTVASPSIWIFALFNLRESASICGSFFPVCLFLRRRPVGGLAARGSGG
jgi:hypothetical protein